MYDAASSMLEGEARLLRARHRHEAVCSRHSQSSCVPSVDACAPALSNKGCCLFLAS
jgi:hypothetical protein